MAVTAMAVTMAVGGIGVLLVAARWAISREWINMGRDHPLLVKRRLDGRVVVVTGANTGLGRVVAEDVAKRGAKVVLACRNVVAGKKAARGIEQASGNANVRCMLLDLASLESVRTFAREVSSEFPKIDYLVCNAGVLLPMGKGSKTADGYEMHFGVNHLGHFLLVRLLEESVDRVVTVSSYLMEGAEVDDVDGMDLANGRAQSFLDVAPSGYRDSKMMNVMFTKELVKRNRRVKAYSVCPGFASSELRRDVFGLLQKVLFLLPSIAIMRTRKQGADNIIFLVLQDEEKLKNGGFYENGKLSTDKDERVDKMTEACRKLWDLSDSLVEKS